VSWEYQYLKECLGLQCSPLLSMFESYCASTFETSESMEWSCKFKQGNVLPERFVHSSKIRNLNNTFEKLKELIKSLDIGSMPASLNFGEQDMQNLVERVFVAYAGADAASDKSAIIKIGFALKGYNEKLYSSLIKPLFGELLQEPLPGNPGVIIGFATDGLGHFWPRLYIFYERHEYAEPSVVYYLQQRIGAIPLAIMRSYPKSAIAFKAKSTDMIYVSLQDSYSHLKTIVVDESRRLPLFHERLNRLKWIGIPIEECRESIPQEMNVFVELLH
jgi:hypothetical protein